MDQAEPAVRLCYILIIIRYFILMSSWGREAGPAAIECEMPGVTCVGITCTVM